jgi:hypothetical protein
MSKDFMTGDEIRSRLGRTDTAYSTSAFLTCSEYRTGFCVSVPSGSSGNLGVASSITGNDNDFVTDEEVVSQGGVTWQSMSRKYGTTPALAYEAGFTTFYYTDSSIVVGTVIYTSMDLTAFAPDGYYMLSTNFYYHVYNNGTIMGTGTYVPPSPEAAEYYIQHWRSGAYYDDASLAIANLQNSPSTTLYYDGSVSSSARKYYIDNTLSTLANGAGMQGTTNPFNIIDGELLRIL